MKALVPTERQVQRAVLQMVKLAFPKVICFHVPNGVFLAGSEADRKRQMGILLGDGLLPGMSDLIAIWKGGVAFLEVKKPGGKLSDVQAEMHTRLALLGYECAVVHSPSAAFDHLKYCGAPTNMNEWPA